MVYPAYALVKSVQLMWAHSCESGFGEVMQLLFLSFSASLHDHFQYSFVGTEFNIQYLKYNVLDLQNSGAVQKTMVYCSI